MPALAVSGAGGCWLSSKGVGQGGEGGLAVCCPLGGSQALARLPCMAGEQNPGGWH